MMYKFQNWFIQIFSLVKFELCSLYKNKIALAMVLILPFLQALSFSFAINKDPKHLPTALISYDSSPLVRSLISGIINSEYFNIVLVNNEYKAKQMILQGQINNIITIPAGFTKDLIRGKQPQVLLEYDATDAGTSNVAINFSSIVTQVIDEYMRYGLNKNPIANTNGTVQVVSQRSFNEQNQSIYNTIPGVMGTLLSMIMVLGSIQLITQARENHSLKKLIDNGASPSIILFGKGIPLLFIGSLHLFIIILIGKLIFGIYTLQQPLLLYLASLIYMWANISLGILISSLCKSTGQALQLGIFYQLSAMFFSGSLYSYHAMPVILKYIANLMPITHYLLISRGLMLKNMDLTTLMLCLMPIIICACSCSLLAILRIKEIFRILMKGS